jgi:hypothetical protein
LDDHREMGFDGGATQKIQVLNTRWHGDIAGRLGK